LKRLNYQKESQLEDDLPMKKIVASIVAVLIGAAALSYAVDYLFWRYRVVTGHNPYETLTVQFYYAVQEKNGKTEYDFQPPQQETCANSFFPHAGYSPCWYERKHTEKAIRV
jgi:hypothetical protein